MKLRNLRVARERKGSIQVSWTFDLDESSKINCIFALSKTF